MKANPPFYYHILLFISLYLVLKLWILGFRPSTFSAAPPLPIILFSITYICTVFAVYCIGFYIFCPLLYRKKYLLYLASIPLMLIIFVGLRFLLEEVIIYNITGFHNYSGETRKMDYYIADNVFFGFPAVALSTLSFLFWHFLHFRKYNQQLILENQKAQFHQLKSQISPHFLFNILNSFYSDWIEKDEKAAADLMTLTNLLRYMITENDKEYVLLTEEIGFLNNYIQLQRKRFEDQLFLDFSITGNCSSQTILPSVLIQFAENLFKYGKLNEPSDVATIKINIEAGSLELTTSNLILSGENYYTTGTGFKNLSQRLEFAYKGNYTLNKDVKNNTFITYLKIPLHNNL